MTIRSRWTLLPALLVTAACLFFSPARAAYLQDVEQTITQPDGSVLNCFASGDEHYHWLHDSKGYVIVQDPDSGWFVYAKKVSGKLVPTPHIPNKVDPASVGLTANVKPDRDVYNQRRSILSIDPALPPVQAPRNGTLNNVVVFIRFAGEVNFPTPITTYDSMFNSTTSTSMRRYFIEASYSALTIDTIFLPEPAGTVVQSFQDAYPRAYYKKYNATTNPTGYQTDTERTDREHTLLANAVAAIAPNLPAGLDVDLDNDGRVDNVCFIVKGGAEGWSDLLWPHAWALYSKTAMLGGARVWTFNFQLETSLSGSASSVLSHEMGHSLGLPDLYHYNGDGLNPVGEWDLMAYNRTPPQHMSAYMKWRYVGWISQIPVITKSGVYTLNPISIASNNSYRIPSPNSATQYFVVEYRGKMQPFETSLPGAGLVVYRINTAQSGKGNDEGPPDEVYVLRPGGTPTLNGNLGSAFLTSTSGRTMVGDYVGTRGILADGSPAGISITSIGAAGTTISFQVNLPLKWTDVADALRRASGITPAAAMDLTYMNPIKVAPSDAKVDILDAIRMARKVSGLEPNP